MVHKCPEAIITYLGVAQAGGIFFPIDHNQGATQIGHVLAITKPAALVVSSSMLPILEAVKPFLGSHAIIIVIGQVWEGDFVPWEHAIKGLVQKICSAKINAAIQST